MDVIVQPPRLVAPGTVLDPPLVVRLEGDPGTKVPSPDERRLFSVATLTNESTIESLESPHWSLMDGNRVGSLQTLARDDESAPTSNHQELGFFSFPDIAIRKPGLYRLRVDLHAFNVGSDTQGPTKYVSSDIIAVAEAGAPRPSKCSSVL